MKVGSQDRAQLEMTHADVWNEAIEAAAVAAEAPGSPGGEWVPGSIWDAMRKSTAKNIRRLQKVAIFDLIKHLERQRRFSSETFGPGMRTKGVCDHIRKELNEIEAKPEDLEEWVDVILLALDGAWRSGHDPEQICKAIAAKQIKNENRDWPDWRTQPPDKAIEHNRG